MEPYLGEIRIFAGNFAPVGWAFCNGALLSVSEYDALFTLLGTTYGGDGVLTFGLPDLRGRIPVHAGNGYNLGQMAGLETVTLTAQQIPAHTHAALGNTQNGTETGPANNYWAGSTLKQYSAAAATIPMSAATTTFAGGSQPHDNMMPYLAINFIIATVGIFPQQN